MGRQCRLHRQNEASSAPSPFHCRHSLAEATRSPPSYMTTLRLSSLVDDGHGGMGLFPFFFSFSSLESSLHRSHSLVEIMVWCGRSGRCHGWWWIGVVLWVWWVWWLLLAPIGLMVGGCGSIDGLCLCVCRFVDGLVVCVCVCVCVVIGLDRWIGVSWVYVCGFVCWNQC